MPHSKYFDKNLEKNQPYKKEPLIQPEILMNAPVGIFTSTPEGRIISANETLARMLGYETSDDLMKSTIEAGEIYASSEDRKRIKQFLEAHGEIHDYKCQWIHSTGKLFWVSIHAKAIRDEEEKISFYQGFISDITKRKLAEEALGKIDWMLSSQQAPFLTADNSSETAYIPPYGNLTELNACRQILDTVEEETLKNIVGDFLDLLDTSVAVYEANGDYALGMFSSDWCRFMDQASYHICKTEDRQHALRCGKWICHESCWDTAKQAIETGKPVDRECEGGIRLYAVPINANGKIIGTINVGFGDPPTDTYKLSELALKYSVDVKDLTECSNAYESRPPFIVELAKRRIHSAAHLIGEIVERKQAEHALRVKTEEQALLLDSIPVQIWYLKDPETYGALNKAHAEFMGLPRETLANKKLDEFLQKQETQICKEGNIEVFKRKRPVYKEEWLRDARGQHRLIAITKTPKLYENGEVEYVVCSGVDITEKKEAEERLWLALQGSKTGLWDWYLQNGTVFVNEQWAEIAGYKIEELEPLNIQTWKNLCHPDDMEISNEKLEQHFSGKTDLYECEVRMRHKDGSWVYVLDRGKVFEWDHDGNPLRMTGTHIDITEKKRIEKEQENLHQQLLHSQKMESVGRLAGGVAHEFNNMLSIINGYAEMMTDILSPSEPLFDNAQKIQDAGKRSAVIVRKLLAFARKQIITPEVINLNDSVSSMLTMLQKLIGENIELLWKPDKTLWPIKMDHSQIDQILANLVVNARDAIYNTGEIIIETKNIEFDKEYCAAHPGFIPGQYVMLAVSDTGCGMNKEIQAQLFEPFFTTKEVGKGTGLGLPTVYGIVKQNKGFVNVYSEPGKGTTFKIYFPCNEKNELVSEAGNEEVAPVRGHDETILILEDEAAVLGIARMMLEKLGYHVLAAETPNKAIKLAEAHEGKIDLLLTDVVMPEMNGRDFANQLKTLYPNVKILFMSGYTANVIAHHNVVDKKHNFLEKPFTLKNIALKVREALSS